MTREPERWAGRWLWARRKGYGHFLKNRPDASFSIFQRSNEAKLEHVSNSKVREEVSGFIRNFTDRFLGQGAERYQVVNLDKNNRQKITLFRT